MTPDSSRFDLSTLRATIAAWWSEQVGDLDPAAAEQLALVLSRELGQTLLATAWERSSGKASYQGTQLACSGCGGEARFVGYRSRWLRTRCGDQRVERAYYHCARCHQGRAPWDEAAGLNQRMFTPAAKALVVECCGHMPHRCAEAFLERVAGLKAEESTQQALVEEVGARLRSEGAAEREACFERLEPIAPETEAAVERLYVSLDAAKAHLGGDWRDVKCAAIYTATPEVNRSEEGRRRDRMGTRRYLARQEGAAPFGEQVYVAALRAGLAAAREVVVIADGAEWIWNLAAAHFHGAVQILDYYHAAEHIWALVPVLYGEGSAQGKRWAEARCRDLKENGPQGLLRALTRRKPQGATQQEALRKALGYFRTHRQRMAYPRFRARGMMIGSGPVEAACKVVVGARLKGAGMRWSEPGADAMLAVRTALLNGEHERVARHARAA